jgi:hypothetical protein
MSVRPLLAIGLATAGISIAFAAPAAAAPSNSTNQHVVRNSAKATPNGRHTSQTGSHAVPTSNKKVLSSDPGTPVAVKHHWGTHDRHHGIL